jgi:F-type H+-transporting ATPase subunit delta
MAELSTVARPYAEAVFELCVDVPSSTRWSETLAFLEMVVLQPDMAHTIGNPRVSRKQLLGAERLNAEALRFVAALADNYRLALLPQIRSKFEELLRAREGVVDARIETAFALTAAQLATIVRDLEHRFKRGIRPEVAVEPALIGGVKMYIGDEVIDGSVRGRLDRMEAALKF